MIKRETEKRNMFFTTINHDVIIFVQVIFVEDKERAESAMGGAEAAAVDNAENKQQPDIKIWVSWTYSAYIVNYSCSMFVCFYVNVSRRLVSPPNTQCGERSVLTLGSLCQQDIAVCEMYLA